MNISEIAKLAGVSPATISRYLNDGYVSEAKRAVIKRVIDETGYTPLASAQNLRAKKTGIIGVIVPKISSESVSRMVDGITRRLADTGYNIFLANTNNDVKSELDYLQLFKGNFVDGVIFTATEMTKKHQQVLKTYPKPVVVLGQHADNVPCVYHDDRGAAKTAVTHLLDQGCRRIACLGVKASDEAAGNGRHHGYLDALAERGLNAEPDLFLEVDFSIADGYKGILTILDRGMAFDGLFCATDNIAIGAINCLHYSHLSVPDDVKVVGIGDSMVSKALLPPLSSVHLFYHSSGQEAAAIMVDLLEREQPLTKQLCLGYDLIERESSYNL